jgi:hypothetical protein
MSEIFPWPAVATVDILLSTSVIGVSDATAQEHGQSHTYSPVFFIDHKVPYVPFYESGMLL